MAQLDNQNQEPSGCGCLFLFIIAFFALLIFLSTLPESLQMNAFKDFLIFPILLVLGMAGTCTLFFILDKLKIQDKIAENILGYVLACIMLLVVGRLLSIIRELMQ